MKAPELEGRVMPNAGSPTDPWAQVAMLVRLIRTGEAQTRPELAEATGLGRNVITLRVQAAEAIGLIRASGAARSRGGRAADIWEFTGVHHHVLVATVDEDGFRVVLANLDLTPLGESSVEWTLSDDTARTCERMAAQMETLISDHRSPTIWGIGLGMPAPVDVTTGRSRDPVIAGAKGIRWPRTFDIRRWFIDRMKVPVWVDSVSNLAALGAASEPEAPADLVFVRLGNGVGSGIVSNGGLHRGADSLAGEITHIVVSDDARRLCLCGRSGCVDAFAGSWAIEAEARRAVAQGRSPFLAARAEDGLGLAVVVAGAESGDIACAEIVHSAAEALGRGLATVVTWFNPRRVVVAGNDLASSPLFRHILTRTLQSQALSACIEHLELRIGPGQAAEVVGGLSLVRDALLAPSHLAAWAPTGSPADFGAAVLAIG
ncbi:ROK family protein [Virgisporangium aurantiacum]|uniref:ROK family protein n=1 Tax=Virgisporangium aurantiacum TaxID=175570 RepID=UPI00194FB322|nr:ROK family protein [Virgisporangium aurantiacum]